MRISAVRTPPRPATPVVLRQPARTPAPAAVQNQKPASSKPAVSAADPSINKLYTPQMVYQNAAKAAVNQSNVSERKDPANKQQSTGSPAKGTGGSGDGTRLTDPTKHGDGTTLTDPAKHGQAPAFKKAPVNEGVQETSPKPTNAGSKAMEFLEKTAYVASAATGALSAGSFAVAAATRDKLPSMTKLAVDVGLGLSGLSEGAQLAGDGIHALRTGESAPAVVHGAIAMASKGIVGSVPEKDKRPADVITQVFSGLGGTAKLPNSPGTYTPSPAGGPASVSPRQQ